MLEWTNIYCLEFFLTLYVILTLILCLFVNLLIKEMEERRENNQYSLAELTLILSKRVDELEKREE